jgi:hypothetical protein
LTLTAGGQVSGTPTTPVDTTVDLSIAVSRAGVTRNYPVLAHVQIGSVPLGQLHWSARATADPSMGSPSMLSCPQPGTCLGLDDFGNVLTYQSSSGWSLSPSIAPQVSDTAAPFCRCYESIHCPTTTFCVVPGAYDSYLQYDQGTWTHHTIPIAPTPDYQVMADCASSSYCAFYDSSTGATYLVSHGAWSAGPTVPATGGFMSVGCDTGTFCMVVGQANYSFVSNGVWSPPGPLPVSLSYVISLDCQSPTSCMLTANSGDLFHWDGTQWTAEPTAGGGFSLTQVSCSSASSCVAAGESTDGTNWVSSTFDGVTWTQPATIGSLVVGTNNDNGNIGNLRCVATFCAALSNSGLGMVFNQGSWTAPVRVESDHQAVQESCSSTHFCALVDMAGYASTFDGTTWSAPVNISGTLIPNSQGVFQPWQISCPIDGWCMAATYQGSVLIYANGGWSAPSSAGQIGSGGPSLSCVSPTFCVALDGVNKTVYMYEGNGFTSVALNGPIGSAGAVSCVGTSFCMATTGAGAYAYDGQTWTPVPADSTDFYQMTCASSLFCAAYGPGNQPDPISVFDGVRWRSLEFSYSGDPTAISCPATGECLLVTSTGTSYLFDGASLSPTGAITAGFGAAGLSCAGDSWCQEVDTLGYGVIGTSP